MSHAARPKSAPTEQAGMLGLSLYNPWAFLVAIAAKRIETRDWQTSHRGFFAIHATKAFDEGVALLCFQDPFKRVLLANGIRRPKELLCGAIVAVCRVAGCARAAGELVQQQWAPVGSDERAFGNYGHGRWAWQLCATVRLPEPALCRSKPSPFALPPEVEAAVRVQLPNEMMALAGDAP